MLWYIMNLLPYFVGVMARLAETGLLNLQYCSPEAILLIPQKYPGHKSIDLFVIAQQPECCPHSKKILDRHALLF